MANFKKTQLLTLSLIATLLSFTPLLSSSIRSTYLYFIINVLILVLVAEAGFLSPSSSSSSSSKNTIQLDKKATNANARVVWVIDDEDDNNNNNNNNNNDFGVKSKEKIVEEIQVQEKVILCVDDVKKMIRKCPSTPSIFFIGGTNNNEDEDEDEYEYDEEKGVNGNEEEEELFVKAETFIVNFYKQLKMQRDESLKNFNDFINENNGLVS